MSRGVEFADLGFHERLREIQESEKKIIQLRRARQPPLRTDRLFARLECRAAESRLNYLSLMEIRLLFNYTVLKRVLTPWQTGMCMILCYPMLPDPNFLSCAILGVSDVSEIPWSQFRDLVLAE